MSRLWQALESVNAPAVGAEWRKRAGDEFEILRSAFLRADGDPATSHPCSAGCGCQHRAVHHDDGRIVAVCRCDPPDCESFALTKPDLIAYGIHWTRLGRAIAKALDCDFKPAGAGLAGVHQIATFSGLALPLFLVIQTDPDEFRHALAHLSAGGRPLVVLAPTERWMDDRGHALIGPRSGFLGLQSHVTILADGSLRANRPGAELLSRFVTSHEEPPPENVARQVFKLIEELESEAATKPPSVLTVFRLYCGKLMPAEQVATQCGCSKGTVINRLKLIREKTGTDPDGLRRFSPHFETIENDIRDSRAEHIHRKRLIRDDDAGGEDGE